MTGLTEPVLVVGTGLIGTSLALSLRRAGVPVWLFDRDAESLAVAVELGAGQPLAAEAAAAHEAAAAQEAAARQEAAGGQEVAAGQVPQDDREAAIHPAAMNPAAVNAAAVNAAAVNAAAVNPDAGDEHAAAGRPGTVAGAAGPEVGLVVVAVPPAATASVIVDALRRYPRAVVTDVASVKDPIRAALVAANVDIARYVGGHPMAGSEVSGPAAARADLIDDRPWVITPHPQAEERATLLVQELALAARALPVLMPAAEHDRAVAVVSHTPQILSSLLAARLLDSSDTVVSIAGQGLRDMTRIAASNRDLWVEILSANAAPVAAVLSELSADLQQLLTALGGIEHGGRDVVAEALLRGNVGRDRVPGKHGARPAPTAEVPVVVADQPGELGRLFAAVAEAGCSVEDVRIEHSLGRPTGVVEITVGQAAAEPLAEALRAEGWDVRA